MQINFKFTMITLGRTKHHDFCFQNEMSQQRAAHCYHSLRHVRSVDNLVPRVLSLPPLKMAARIRCSEWEKDEQLKSDLECYVLANYSRQEILDFASRDYPEYAWSLPTLSRRLNFFGIKYIRYETSIEDVNKAVQEEMEGPGQYLGYRAMQRKLREQHKLAVPRNLVYDVMGMVDPEGLKRRGNVGHKKRQRGATGTFTSLVRSQEFVGSWRVSLNDSIENT